MNEMLEVRNVRLIDDTGTNIGIVPINVAMGIADEVGLDLVEVSPSDDAPVCKLMDYGRFKYEAQKKAAEARKKRAA